MRPGHGAEAQDQIGAFPDRFVEAVGAADQEYRRPFARRRVARMAEIAVIFLVAAFHGDHLDGGCVQRGGGAVVFVIEERKARIRRIRLGEAVGGRFEVLEGVKAGDMAVVRGNERLREGQRVRVRGGGE